jgi:AraC-like DNA-binding protein
MSLQMAYERSTKDQVVDLRSIDLSRVDHGQTKRSLAERLFPEDATLSLRHLDVAVAVTAGNGDAGRSPEGVSCFKVSTKRLVDRSRDIGPSSPGGDDPVLQRLSEALAEMEAAHDRHSGVCADALRLAILTRQFSGQPNLRAEQPFGRNAKSLQKWRLKRVLQYVDDHLAAKITLQGLAEVAGLSRMHFAAQFRAATGLRPHQYVLKRRIEHAEDLLKQAEISLVEVALTVGFQTQAHFTTVFKRFAGDTPYQWRSAYLAQCIPASPARMRMS